MRQLLFISLFFLALPHAFGQRKVTIHVKKANCGHYCYILWTSDTTKCNPKDTTRKLFFDKNNIIYVHHSMVKKGDSVRIFNTAEQNISKQMFNIMESDDYLYFYCPTEKELKKHPHFDAYYINKLKKNWAYLPEQFKKMGYILESLK